MGSHNGLAIGDRVIEHGEGGCWATIDCLPVSSQPATAIEPSVPAALGRQRVDASLTIKVRGDLTERGKIELGNTVVIEADIVVGLRHMCGAGAAEDDGGDVRNGSNGANDAG